MSISIYLHNNFNHILEKVIDIISNMGFNSRTLEKLLDGTITSATGRNYIADVCIDIIEKHPLFGVGIGLDRFYINQGVKGNVELEFSSSYPHNLIYEILVQYGIIFGTGIIIINHFLLNKI